MFSLLMIYLLFITCFTVNLQFYIYCTIYTKSLQVFEFFFCLQLNTVLNIFAILKASDLLQRGGMYLGAVGAYDWSGTVVKYDRAGDSTPDISTFDDVKEVIPDRPKYSYLGR